MLLQGFQSPITKYYFSYVGITINQIKYLNRCKKNLLVSKSKPKEVNLAYSLWHCFVNQ